MSDWVSSALVPLASTVIGALAAGSGGLIAGKSERSKWLREERREAYRALLTAADALNDSPALRNVGEGPEFDRGRQALADIELLGPAAVVPAAQALAWQFIRTYSVPTEAMTAKGDPRVEFVEAARKVLDS